MHDDPTQRPLPQLTEAADAASLTLFPERVVLEVRRHMSVLLGPFLTTVLAIFLAGAIGWFTSPSEGSDLIDLILGVIALFVAARFGWRTWQWRADVIVVTDQRIFEVSGVLTRKVASMPLTVGRP